MSIIAITLGFFLDLILGDPPRWPHPIRFIGMLITQTEKMIRIICIKETALMWGGLVLWLVVVISAYGLVWIILKLVEPIVWLHLLLEIWISYTILATKSLKDSALLVYHALKTGSLGEARLMLSYIVGRDTTQLSQDQICRAVVETVAENTVDGVIAPLFFLIIGGAPLAMAYKAVNTLDSIVGYQTHRYQSIGFISAKIDDVANYLPARLSWLLFSASALVLRLDAKSALLIGWRDRYQHKSPNCAWSEASVAGALGVLLGGPSVYFGKTIQKPWIGEMRRNIEIEDIIKTINLMYLSAFFALSLLTLLSLLLNTFAMSFL